MNVINFVKRLPDNVNYLIPTDIELVRLGNNTDGGYLIPKIALDKADALLSFGLGENWTFDEDWHKLKPNDTIHLYDGEKTKRTFPPPDKVWNRAEPTDLVPMYERFFVGNRRHYVENIGYNRGETTFKTCLDRLDSSNIFLKSDIEGGEYPLLSDLLNNVDKIIGIAAEFHGVNTNRNQFMSAVLELKKHYELVHVHANVTQPIGWEGLTEAIELTFIRKDLVEDTKLIYDFYRPTLDYSNLLNFPDFEYWFDDNTTI